MSLQFSAYLFLNLIEFPRTSVRWLLLSMIILPKLVQDELALGYVGRLCHINLVSRPEIEKALLAHYQLQRGTEFVLGALGCVSGEAVDEVAFRHTLLPFIANAKLPRRKPSWPVRELDPLRLVRKFAYFCIECMAQQKQHYGFTYWKRGHQLPGIYWCHQHHEPLVGATKELVSSRLPSLNLREFELDGRWRGDITNPILARYAQMCLRYFSGVRRRALREFVPILRDKALEIGLQVERQSTPEMFLSDLAREHCPDWWLKDVFKGYGMHKLPGAFYPSIDGVLLYSGRVDFRTYALAIALLQITDEQLGVMLD